MTLKERLDQDLKAAMLSGDQQKVMVLRGLKSTILYAEVAQGKRQSGLGEPEIVTLLQKEAKKRQESADLYRQGNSSERATKELEEKEVIESYLPDMIDEAELSKLIDQAIEKTGASSLQDMAKIIALVKQQTAGSADGAAIAGLVKERLIK